MRAITVLFLISFSFQNIFSQSSDLYKKIGQMIMVGYSGKYIPTILKEDLQKRNLGGVIFFAANITSPSQLKSLTDTIKLLSSVTPFIAIDQEGGKVARLYNANGYSSTNSAYKLGAIINREDSTRYTANMMAEWLKNGGINVNFAPVVDVNINPLSPAIGLLERSFSSNPEDVFKHTQWFIDEFNKKNIVTTLKHFPGHGSALADSHLGFTDISNTWSETELIPYNRLIASGFKDFIMAGHLFNSKFDTLYPSSLSKNTLTGQLRNKMEFKGLIITDELFMQAITQNYTLEQSIELAINAGNDILLFKTNIHNSNSLVEEVINIVQNKINEGKISINRIEEAYNRICEIKRKYQLLNIESFTNQFDIPEKLNISNYPNPFNPRTTIIFNIPYKPGNTGSLVQLKIYDVLGREVETLINNYLPQGVHKCEFTVSNHGTGSAVYFCILKIEKLTTCKKIILQK